MYYISIGMQPMTEEEFFIIKHALEQEAPKKLFEHLCKGVHLPVISDVWVEKYNELFNDQPIIVKTK